MILILVIHAHKYVCEISKFFHGTYIIISTQVTESETMASDTYTNALQK